MWDSWFRPEPAAAQLPPVLDQRPEHPPQHGRHGQHGRPAAGRARKRRKLPYLLVAAVLWWRPGSPRSCAAPRPGQADHRLPADWLIAWSGRPADGQRLPARLGRREPQEGSELHQSPGYRQGRAEDLRDRHPPRAAHQHRGSGDRGLVERGGPAGDGQVRRQRERGGIRRATRSAAPGITTPRWLPTGASTPSTGTSPGRPPTWRPTSRRPLTSRPSRSRRGSRRSPTPAETISPATATRG